MNKSIYFVVSLLFSIFSNLVLIKSYTNHTNSADELIRILQLKFKTKLNIIYTLYKENHFTKLFEEMIRFKFIKNKPLPFILPYHLLN
jgi:hypothetical protein